MVIFSWRGSIGPPHVQSGVSWDTAADTHTRNRIRKEPTVFMGYSFGVRGLDFLIRPSGNSPSVEATTAQTVASPVTLTTVLNMSNILSGAMIKAIPAAGTLMDSNTIINIINPAPGTPAEPMEANVAVNTMVSCWVQLRSIPNACAMKTAATP